MTYTIRPVRPTDLAAVTEVEAICFPAAEAAAEESFKARIAAFPECFFVAEADGKIIGFINGCATDSKTIYDEMYENSACHRPDGAYQSIFGLDVIPDYRCQGIAAALMDHMIEDAKNKGRKGLILTCKDRLIHYYAKFGYKNMGISKSVHGRGSLVRHDPGIRGSEIMKVTLITVGKIKEKFFQDAIAEYSKRLSRYCKLEIVQVADEKTPDGASEAVETQIKEKEGERFCLTSRMVALSLPLRSTETCWILRNLRQK